MVLLFMKIWKSVIFSVTPLITSKTIEKTQGTWIFCFRHGGFAILTTVYEYIQTQGRIQEFPNGARGPGAVEFLDLRFV